jgi:hypothetical protein
LLLSCDAASIWNAFKNLLAKSLVIIDHQVEELLSFAMQPGVHIARAFAVLLFWFRSCCFFSYFVAGTHRLPFSGVLTLIALLYFGLLDGLGLWFNLLGIPFFLFDFIKIKLWQFSFALIQIWLCSLIDAKIDEAGVDVESIQNILRNAQ